MSYKKYLTVAPMLTNAQTQQFDRVDAGGRLIVTTESGAGIAADTELPAAAALADATANPTTPLVGAALETFNGATWDRLRGDTANGADVDVTRTSGTGIFAAANTYYNSAVSADVDAAVAAVAGLRLLGFSVRETAGATASLRIVNGATGAAAGKTQCINLAANESAGDWFGPQGIASPLGLSVDWISGAFEITLHHTTVV
jgi:hypothetical protein